MGRTKGHDFSSIPYTAGWKQNIIFPMLPHSSMITDAQQENGHRYLKKRDESKV